MKYFAKYLPVEGKGTSEDLYIFKINGEWTEPCNFDDVLGEGIEDVKLVKLHLCQIVEGVNIIQEGVYILHDNPRNIPPFKVIGEISPDATWVKDGDELDEDCVAFMVSDEGEWFWFPDGEKEFILSSRKKRVEIKGPCGHFH